MLSMTHSLGATIGKLIPSDGCNDHDKPVRSSLFGDDAGEKPAVADAGEFPQPSKSRRPHFGPALTFPVRGQAGELVVSGDAGSGRFSVLTETEAIAGYPESASATFQEFNVLTQALGVTQLPNPVYRNYGRTFSNSLFGCTLHPYSSSKDYPQGATGEEQGAVAMRDGSLNASLDIYARDDGNGEPLHFSRPLEFVPFQNGVVAFINNGSIQPVGGATSKEGTISYDLPTGLGFEDSPCDGHDDFVPVLDPNGDLGMNVVSVQPVDATRVLVASRGGDYAMAPLTLQGGVFLYNLESMRREAVYRLPDAFGIDAISADEDYIYATEGYAANSDGVPQAGILVLHKGDLNYAPTPIGVPGASYISRALAYGGGAVFSAKIQNSDGWVSVQEAQFFWLNPQDNKVEKIGEIAPERMQFTVSPIVVEDSVSGKKFLVSAASGVALTDDEKRVIGATDRLPQPGYSRISVREIIEQ